MRVALIGGTGHIGTYLVPLLVETGHEVICISRQLRSPYREHAAWKNVVQRRADRIAEDKTGRFAPFVRSLNPDVVIDLICYEPDSARQLVEALRGHIQHLITCGTISVYGHSVRVPTTEEMPRQPLGDYGAKKAEIERYLLEEAREREFPVTVLHPGHITGPGWEPLNPVANKDMQIFEQLARGDEVALPNLGMETVHHVHAADVASAFMLALDRRATVVGESFNIVAPYAMTLRGYAEMVASWYGKPAKLRFLPLPEWRQTTSDENASKTWDVLRHSPNISIAKAQQQLGYAPSYEGIEAVREAVDWLVAHQRIKLRDDVEATI